MKPLNPFITSLCVALPDLLLFAKNSMKETRRTNPVCFLPITWFLFLSDPTPSGKPAVIWHKTFCKDCFGKFTGKSCTKPDVTCADRQQELVDNKHAFARKRGWWTRLKISDPDQAQEFLKACQLSEAEVDERLKVGIATYSARKWKLT